MSQTALFSEGDFVINDLTGQPYMITGRTKGVQDVIFTLQADAPYGAGLQSRFGKVPSSGAAFSAELTQAARAAIDQLAVDQGRYNPEAYTSDETIDQILAVRAEQLDDPTAYRFLVRVRLGIGPIVQFGV